MQKFFILGTLKRPLGLLRESRDEGLTPFAHFDPAIPPDGDFVPSQEAGSLIHTGDTLLTDLPADQVDTVKARIRVAVRGSQAVADA